MTDFVDFEEPNKLELIVKESGLEKTKADVILAKFQNYFELSADWERKARTIVVTDEKQIDDMKMARTGRLLLREKRLEIEKTRKELKEQALREGKAIDGVANVLKALICPIEEYLERQEKFVEFKVAAQLEQKRLDDERKAVEAEQARLQAEAAEQARVRTENAKLQAEIARKNDELAKAKEIENQARAKADAERKVAEAKANAERMASEQKSAAEKKAIQDKADAERREAERKHAAEIKAAQDKAAKEREVARLKAEEERKEKERLEKILKNTVKCPHCKKEFLLDKEEF